MFLGRTEQPRFRTMLHPSGWLFSMIYKWNLHILMTPIRISFVYKVCLMSPQGMPPDLFKHNYEDIVRELAPGAEPALQCSQLSVFWECFAISMTKRSTCVQSQNLFREERRGCYVGFVQLVLSRWCSFPPWTVKFAAHASWRILTRKPTVNQPGIT